MEFSQFIFPCVASIHTYFSLDQFLSMGTISHALEEQVYSQEKEKLTRNLRKLEKYTGNDFRSLRRHSSLVQENVWIGFEFLPETLSLLCLFPGFSQMHLVMIFGICILRKNS